MAKHPEQGVLRGPSHSVCTLCGTTLVAGWPLYDGSKYKLPAKTQAAPTSPSRRVPQPGKSKEVVELEKELVAAEKKLASRTDDEDEEADDDITVEPKNAEHFTAVLQKQEAERATYTSFLTQYGHKLEGDARLEAMDQAILETKRLRDTSRSPVDQGHLLHTRLRRLEKGQEKDMAIMRKAAEDEEEAEKRHAVAKARWDRRADAAAAIHLELSRLQYLRPSEPGAGDAVHAKLAAAVVGCKEVIAANASTADAGLMQFVEQKLADASDLPAGHMLSSAD